MKLGWTDEDKNKAVALLSFIIPSKDIKRVIGEIERGGWGVIDTASGQVSFSRQDLSFLRKLLDKKDSPPW